ncbi:MAG: TatD family hydrolase [Candidatus Heimdallarchaeota archaeon]
MLVETDGPCRNAPDIPPDAPRSKPTYIKKIITKVAKIRDTPVDELNDLVVDNFRSFVCNDARLAPYLM